MADQVATIIAELDRFAARIVTKITLDCTANLIETTPIDTGWARSNWVPSVGDGTGPAQPASKPGPAEVAGAQGQQQAGLASVLAGYRISLGRVTIANGVPYIQRLNDGHSQQAPAGFVQRAIEKAVRSDLLSVRQ